MKTEKVKKEILMGSSVGIGPQFAPEGYGFETTLPHPHYREVYPAFL